MVADPSVSLLIMKLQGYMKTRTCPFNSVTGKPVEGFDE